MLVPFRAKGQLDWPSLGQRTLPVTFEVPGSPGVRVRIEHEETPETSLVLMITTQADFEPPDEILSDLRDLNGLDGGATEQVRAYGDDARDILRLAADRVVGNLAWRVGDPHMPSSAGLGPVEFFLDGKWGYVPMAVGASFVWSHGTQLTAKQVEDVNALLAQGLTEPLAHTVWREAWRLRDQSPRGALLLGVAALEVGVKEFIAGRVPDAEWLVQEVPTPPLMKMLQNYLPALTADDPKPFARLKKPASDIVTKAVERRNDVAHKSKKAPLTRGELKATLDTLRAVIYLLDAQDGHEFTGDQNWSAN